uniref:Uncharacterized protein n=1 Tax=Arundo donax TaxID=35708 RepID=A0A0A9C3Z1_ARUDO
MKKKFPRHLSFLHKLKWESTRFHLTYIYLLLRGQQ